MSKYITSNEHTGNTELPTNRNRDYFAVFPISGDMTVTFNKGSGAIPVREGGFYEPYLAPTSEITLVGGTYVIVEG